MLDRSKAEAASPRSRALAYGIASVIAFALAGWLAYTGIGDIRDGCGCYDPVRDEVAGGALVAVAVAFAIAGVLLALRVLRLVTRKLRAES